ncbi:S-adenosyl-L-methionine-dependent methyltransferase [Ramicandelaber brevisporus]|nr:S-adenosyl-L-methionine-dependent methyltransferase [Ramicandelaber brevisporus]
MTGRFSYADAASEAYCQQRSLPEPEYLKRLAQLTKEREGFWAVMLVNPLQGAALQQFVQMTGAKNILEIGCFTGYSAGWMAEGLIESGADKQGGLVYTVELDSERAKFAEDYANESGRGHLIKVLNKSGNDALASFPDGTKFDLVFIDADKSGYEGYIRTLLDRNLLSPNGAIITDNVTFGGYVQKVDNETGKLPEEFAKEIKNQVAAQYIKEVEAVAKFNNYIHNEPRLNAVLLPLFDGLHIITQKRV